MARSRRVPSQRSSVRGRTNQPDRYLVAAWTLGWAMGVLPGCADEVESEGWELPLWSLVEDLRLDANGEDFSAFSTVSVSALGRIAVPLPQDRQVWLYDIEGRRVSAFGQRGSGPGEFEHVGPITWLGDTLVVDDGRLRRLTYFGLDGTVLRTQMLPPPFGAVPIQGAPNTTFGFFYSLGVLSSGAVLGLAYLDTGSGPGQAVRASRGIVALEPNGEARLVALAPDELDERWMITVDGRSNPVPFALQPEIVVSTDGNRFAFLTADQSDIDGTFDIAVFTPVGDTAFVRQFPFRGDPIPAAKADSAIDAFVPTLQAGRREFLSRARSQFPAVYTPVETLTLALDQTVWVTLRTTVDERDALILDVDGSPLARAALPAHSRIQQASASHVWMTETDLLGLTSVVRYRIVP